MVKRTAHLFRGLTLLAMGCMAIAAMVIAAQPFGHYQELARGTEVYYTVSLAGGVVLLVCPLLALGFPQMQTAALAGTVAAFIIAINHAMGLRYSTILCFTPT